MMDAMKVAAVLRSAAENAGCGLHEVVSGGGDCPEGSCNGCREMSAAWANEAADAIERCAMPDGVEWPRYESGEPVPIGSEFMGKDGKTYTAKQIQFIGKCFSLFDFCDRKPQFSGFYGERVKRPAVLAADGEPLEVGQTVWNVNNGMEFTVSRLPKLGEYQAVEVRYRNGSSTSFDPDQLTHQCPVLDADGAPIKVGDTVWGLDGFEYVVCEVCKQKVAVEFLRDGIAAHGSIAPSLLTHQHPVLDADGAPIKVGDTVYGTVEGGPFIVTEVSGKGSVFVDSFPDTGMHGSMLTHTKPEPVDTWERIEEDKGLNPFDYCKKVGHKLWTFDNAEEAKASDLVRRAKKLAGVDND